MKQTTIEKWKARRELIGKYVKFLFPTPRAYFNFWMFIIFFGVLTAIREQDLVLISALATGYFVNEWIKEIYKK